MLSPFEQNTTIGERMLRRSIAVPSEVSDLAGGELVADEQVVDDGLDLRRVQIDVTAPPALEAEIARGLGVDLGIEIVSLASTACWPGSGSRNSAPARRRRTCRGRGRW